MFINNVLSVIASTPKPRRGGVRGNPGAKDESVAPGLLHLPDPYGSYGRFAMTMPCFLIHNLA
jgi:hypothetical protein